MSPNELSELAPLAENLNAKSNDINETLKLVNKKLSALNLGIEAWVVSMDRDPDDEPDSDESCPAIQIGFAKVEDVWQLATRNCEAIVKVDERYGYKSWVAVPGTCDLDRTPILQASRDARIEALTVLPELIADIKSKLEAKLKAIDAGKKIAAEL